MGGALGQISQHAMANKGTIATSNNASADIRCIWKGPATLGECPLWDERSQRLYWIDSLEQRIWQSDADGGSLQVWHIGEVIGSIGLCEDKRLVAGLENGFALIALTGDSASVTRIGNPEPELADTRLNDGKVDRQGRFWCGSMNRNFASANASLYRLDPDLTWHRQAEEITVSNGIAFSLDGGEMYFSDSRVDQSFQFDLDPATGRLSNRRKFVNTGAYQGRIDGATVDEEGNYWGALFEGSAIGCFSPAGELVRKIELPVSCPTMCAFGGLDMSILYVTSATFSLGENEREADAGALFAIHGIGVRGVPEPRFAMT